MKHESRATDAHFSEYVGVYYYLLAGIAMVLTVFFFVQ